MISLVLVFDRVNILYFMRIKSRCKMSDRPIFCNNTTIFSQFPERSKLNRWSIFKHSTTYVPTFNWISLDTNAFRILIQSELYCFQSCQEDTKDAIVLLQRSACTLSFNLFIKTCQDPREDAAPMLKGCWTAVKREYHQWNEVLLIWTKTKAFKRY